MKSSKRRTLNVEDSDAGRCPLCGGDRFDPYPEGDAEGSITLSCPDCGLACMIYVGPESASWDVRAVEWRTTFPKD